MSAALIASFFLRTAKHSTGSRFWQPAEQQLLQTFLFERSLFWSYCLLLSHPSRRNITKLKRRKMDTTKVEGGDVNWPESLADHIIENPVRDLLDKAVDYSQNVLGDLWIERGSYVVINGPTGVGKSVLSVQIGVEAALGRETFGIKVDRPLKVLIVQAEDSKNDRIGQFQTILKRLSPDVINPIC
jgi:hypothetical protein